VQRRDFFGACAGATLGAAAAIQALPIACEASSAESEARSVSFSISVMLWTVFQELPFEQRLEKVAEAGYNAVELVDEFKQWGKQDYERVRRKKRELGISFDATAGISRSLCDPSQRDALMEEIRNILPKMEELECSRLILLSGDRVARMSSGQLHASCVEALKRASDITAGENVELLLENIDPEENPRYFLTPAAEGFEIVREVGNPRVNFLYDFFHDQIAEGNLLAKLEKNFSLVGLVHVADVPGRHEPGTGEINYSNIYRKLAELGYNRYVAMEFLPTGDAVASLRAAREMATQHGHTAQNRSSSGLEPRRFYGAA
jgi:hydroxypyruvate isomerase